jgi:hypothetical protein
MGPMTIGQLARPTILHVEYTQILPQSEKSHFCRQQYAFFLATNSEAIVVIIFAALMQQLLLHRPNICTRLLVVPTFDYTHKEYTYFVL